MMRKTIHVLAALLLLAATHMGFDTADTSSFPFRLPETVKQATDVVIANPISYFAISIVLFVAMIWLRQGRVEDAAVLACAAGALLMSLGFRGRARHAYIREQLGDDLAEVLTQDELDSYIAAAQEMTADDVRRFIFERL